MLNAQIFLSLSQNINHNTINNVNGSLVHSFLEFLNTFCVFIKVFRFCQIYMKMYSEIKHNFPVDYPQSSQFRYYLSGGMYETHQILKLNQIGSQNWPVYNEKHRQDRTVKNADIFSSLVFCILSIFKQNAQKFKYILEF